jgi:hypothetical protein
MGNYILNSFAHTMAKTMQPAITDLSFLIPAFGGSATDSKSYVDTAKELSKINRRLYSQQRMYGYQGLTFIWKAAAANGAGQTLTTLECTVKTAGNTWVVQNSYVKGLALWHQMQALVLDDNPSVAGKWHDFKTRLIYSMTDARTLEVLDGAGIPVLSGEWTASKFVMPQHEVDLTTGEPLPALELTTSLIGVDNTPGTIKSLTQAYADSRATVQAPMPNVPAAFSDSFYTLLTDSGSQEPELAQVIEDEADNPPYDRDAYPGGSTNANVPTPVGYAAISQSEVDGRIGGFVAPCGLLEIEIIGYDQDGLQFPVVDMPEIGILLHLAPGSYKGVASIPMGQ